MAKKTSLILGIVFLLLGIAGFLMPHALGTHLSPTHNIIHFISGAAAVYYGLSNDAFARRFCVLFGGIYFLLGVLGFALGTPSAPTVPVTGPQANEDEHLWRLLPETLELGDRDHTLHIVVGSVFLAAGLLPLKSRKAVARPREVSA